MNKSTCIIYENNIPLHIFDNVTYALECMCQLCNRLIQLNNNINISMTHITTLSNTSICVNTTQYKYDKTKQMIVEIANNGKTYTQAGETNIYITKPKVRQEIRQEVKQEIKQEIKQERKQELKQELKQEAIQEIIVTKPINEKQNERIAILKSDKNTYTILNNKISNRQMQIHNISILFKYKFYIIRFMDAMQLILLDNDANIEKEKDIYFILQNIVDLYENEKSLNTFLDNLEEDYLDCCVKFLEYVENLDEKLTSSNKAHELLNAQNDLFNGCEN